MLVFRQSQTAHLHTACLAEKLLVPGAAQESKVARGDGSEVNLLKSIAKLFDCPNLRRASDLLIAGQGKAGSINAGFVEERLMPRNERRRLPTRFIIDRHDRQPGCQESHFFPLTPASLLLRQAEVK